MRVLTEIDEAFREDVWIFPRELSIVAFVKLSVLTAGEQTMLRPTSKVLT